MAFNAYLTFGVKGSLKIGGESTSDVVKHLQKGKTGAIELTDFGFGVSMPVTTTRSDGGGATVGRANFDVFTASKNIDAATCGLMEYCCKGTNIDRIVLHLFRSGDNSDSSSGIVKYAMYVFGNCVITKVAISGSGEELPKESLEFNYGQCEYHYQYTNHDSGLKEGDSVASGWSLIQNKKVTSGLKLTDNTVPEVDAGKSWS
jgi:type VI secretion system secreted protein Hcp